MASPPASSSSSRRHGFRPKADARVLSARTGALPDYPDEVAPVFDPDNYTRPIKQWPGAALADLYYPPADDPYAPTTVPDRPPHHADPYLRACLAANERLRLSMLWYFTHDIFTDKDFLLGLQEKVAVAHEATGW
ncbi:hypothetical protein MN608_07637 [Microdochium nivale]|nr:hypothetical protein MN608_07637 [Microdochium nivale]